MSLPDTIETQRLRLRPIRIEVDADALHPMLSDVATMRYWSSGPHSTVEETRAYLAPSDRREGWDWLIITHADDDHALGWVSAGVKRQAGVVEIGYILSPEATGQGIAREAVAAVIDAIFDGGYRRVFADTDPDNAPSRGLLERLGFREEGTLRGEWETHIGVRDSVIYGLLRDEWATRRD